MKTAEIWAARKARLQAGGRHDTSVTAADFADGVRAVAVELLTNARDVLNDADAQRLYNRFVGVAERIETQK